MKNCFTEIKKKTNILSILSLSLLLFLSSCKDKVEQQRSTEVILPVKTFQVGSDRGVAGKNFPARTKPKREVDIAFRVSGPLTTLKVVEGQKVKKGQVIAKIDDRDFKIELESAKADFELAKVELERYKRLFDKQSIAENEYDTKVAAYRNKEARYIDAKNTIRDATLYAPFDGFIGELLVENYEEVRAKETIVTVLDLSDIEIQFFVPESLLFEKNDIDGFEVFFENYPTKKFKAVFKEVGKVAAAEGFSVRLTLDSNIPDGWEKVDVARAVGFTVKVNILYKDFSKTNRVVIPITAVMEPNAEHKTIVWVLDKNTMLVNKREVELLGFGPQSTIEIDEGLQNGEWIVTAGIHRLKDGQKVKELPTKL